MIEELLKYDTEFFLFLNNLGNTSWDGFWLFVTEKWSSIPIYIILLYLVYKNYGWKGMLVILVCVALMITATDQIANFFKYGVKRPRPCQVDELKTIMRYVADSLWQIWLFLCPCCKLYGCCCFFGIEPSKMVQILAFFITGLGCNYWV